MDIIDEHELAVLKKWGHSEVIPCPSCKGAGWKLVNHGNSRDDDYREELCERCNGDRFVVVVSIRTFEFSLNDDRFNFRHNHDDEKLISIIARHGKKLLSK